jgi:glyoxylase-like metal-dependent hydrolase (beta-lactamase superfamily II)
MGLAVEQLSLGPIGTNCFIVRAERGAPEAAVVDPSGDATGIRLRLAELGARCAAILVTHGHWDHLIGVAELAAGTGAPVHMSAFERVALEDPMRFAPPSVPIAAHSPEVLLEGGETLTLAGVGFDVLAVPGHSPAHLAYAADGCLFSGDVLFAGSVGRTDLPGASWETLLESIRSLVDAYPPETIVYPGHGPATTLGAELARNPFLDELRAEHRETPD